MFPGSGRAACAWLALGTKVQGIYHRVHEHQAATQSPFGGATPVGSRTTAYYVSDTCAEPAQPVVTVAECDDAAVALGLSAGYWPTAPFGGTCSRWNGGLLGAINPAESELWYYYYASNQVGAQMICKYPPPTPSPTPALVPMSISSASMSIPSAPMSISGGAISATGDPHLRNLFGERFDLMKPGRHVLIQIPRWEPAENTLLRVDAVARRLGAHCSDMYFQRLNITGAWADARQKGGYHYDSHSVLSETPGWIRFEKIEMKVVQGRTDRGIQYLNFYVKHLGFAQRAGLAVGGILGEDDHTGAETPPKECEQRLSLVAGAADFTLSAAEAGSTLSVAEASFA